MNTGSAHSTPWNTVNTVAQMTGKRAVTWHEMVQNSLFNCCQGCKLKTSYLIFPLCSSECQFFFSFIKSALLNRALCFVFRLICLLVIHTGRTYYSLNFVLFILFFICSCFCFLFAHMVWLASLLFIYRVLTSPLVTYSQGGLNCLLLPTLPAHLPTLALAALMHLQPISFL